MTTSPNNTEDVAWERFCGLMTVDLTAVGDNYRRLTSETRGREVAAVVKANAYGLGAARVAPALARAGARKFFVAQLDEGIALRPVLDAVQTGCDIFVLNGLVPGAAAEYPLHNLQPVLNSLGEVEAWQRFIADRKTPPPAALHIDTGMNRLGLSPRELDVLADTPERLRGVLLSYLLSHLACADELGEAKNTQQRIAFVAALRRLPAVPASLANSSGIFLGHDYHFDLARPGAALYGVNPTPSRPNPMLQVLRLQGKILQIREIDAPQTVGYGAAHRARGPMRVATVSVGYADGFFRALSNKAKAWIGDDMVPVVGRVSMDLITVDVTAAPPGVAVVGAWVDLLAPKDGLDSLAETAGTIGYEVLTALGPRYHRVYRDH